MHLLKLIIIVGLGAYLRLTLVPSSVEEQRTLEVIPLPVKSVSVQREEGAAVDCFVEDVEFPVYHREELKFGEYTAPLCLGNHQGVAVFAILYPTHSFPSIISQVCKCGKRPELLCVDLHFNAGPIHGPMVLTNTSGKDVGFSIVRELQCSYCSNGFCVCDRPYMVDTSRQHSLGYLRHGNNANVASVIVEPFCMSDPELGQKAAAWSMTDEGVDAVAESYLRAIATSPYRVVVFTVGHYGDRGTSGACFDGCSECKYALRIINAINRRLAPEQISNLTAYSPRYGGDSMEGGYNSSRKGLDGRATVRTLEDWVRGYSEYVTLAASPEWYGRKVIFPTLPFYYKGELHLLRDVPGYVHDTGSAFKGQPSNRFDIPIGRDRSNELMVRNSSSWKNPKMPVMFRIVL